MSKLEELILQYCPEGVEWKTLGELGSFYGGLSGKTKEDFKDGNAKFISYKNIYANPALNIDTDEKVKIAEGEKQHTIEYGDVLFTGSSETPDECGISSVLTQQTDELLYLNSFCFGYRLTDKSIFIPDFLKHLFRSSGIRAQIGKTANGTTRFNVSKKLFADITIPVPPLPVQEEIVRIFDNFSLLSAELEAELEGRRKQYDFYRNQLLSFDSDSTPVVWKTLGEVATFKYGYTDKAKDNGAARYIRITDIDENGCLLPNNAKYIDITEDSTPYLLHPGDIVVARTGATFGKTLYYGLDEQAIYASFLIKIELNNSVLSRYYWHFSKSKYYWEQANKYVSKAGQQQFNSNAICKIKIPIPSLAEQQRIVDILDRFDAICNDLSQGLPAEIDARKKQYEYYRDKLLTFPRKGK